MINLFLIFEKFYNEREYYLKNGVRIFGSKTLCK